MDLICNVPILSTSKAIELTTSPQTLADMGITIDPEAVEILILFEARWTLKAIGRYSRDQAQSPAITTTTGIPIFPYAKICLNKNEFLSTFLAAEGTLPALVEQYTQAEVCDFQAEYRGVIQKLLPIGFAWAAKIIPESNLYKLLNVFGKMFSDLHCTALALIDEFYASTCKQLCQNWADETFDATLDDCLDGFGLSQAQEVKAIVSKIVASGAYRVSDFEDIAAVLDLDVNITDDVPNFTMFFDFINPDIEPRLACATTCARMHDGLDMNLMLAFMCIMEKIGPAQSDKVFTINGACEARL